MTGKSDELCLVVRDESSRLGLKFYEEELLHIEVCHIASQINKFGPITKL